MVSYSQLRKLIDDHYKPFIAVESSNFAEQICKRVGLSTIQLLRYLTCFLTLTSSPYAEQDKLMSFIKFENRSVPLDHIAFHLEYTESISHLDETNIEELLLQTLIRHKPSTDAIHQMIRDFCDETLSCGLMNYRSECSIIHGFRWECTTKQFHFSTFCSTTPALVSMSMTCFDE